MKTVLVGINAKYIHSAAAVYSIAAFAGRFPQTGEICVREFTVNQSHDELLYGILAEKPDRVAFSVYIWNVRIVAQLLKELRRVLPECVLIIGGPEVSFGTKHTGIAAEDFDFCLAGEGERVFAGLLMQLEGREAPADWALRREGRTVRAALMQDLNELPFYFEGRMAEFENRIIYYEASRGCPYSCSYCLSAAEGGLRMKSTETVLRELEYLCTRGARLIKLVDRSFNARPDAARILEYLAQLPEENPVRVHFEIEADSLGEELLEAFAALPKGRVQLEAGIQSTCPEALRACHRSHSVDRLFANLRRLQQAGNLKLHVDLIAGLPEESAERFHRSFSEAWELHADELQLGFLKRLQGAPLCSLPTEDLCFSPEPPYEILRSRWLSPEDLYELKKVEDVLERYGNSGLFPIFLARLEARFPDAWSMFSQLAAFTAGRGLSFRPLGLLDEFALLSDFAGDDEALTEALLCDFYRCSPAEPPAGPLSRLAAKPADAASAARKIMKEAALPGHRLKLRFIRGEALLYDYTEGKGVRR